MGTDEAASPRGELDDDAPVSAVHIIVPPSTEATKASRIPSASSLRILVGVDGTPSSDRAVERVAQRACALRMCEVTLLHVAPVLSKRSRGARTPAEIEASIFAPARMRIRRWSDPQHPTAIRAMLVTRVRADVAGVIGRVIRRGAFDLVVLGRHQHSFLHERLCQHIGTTVMRHLEGCELWVVR